MVLTTVPNKKIAQKIVDMVIKKSLAACCQIIGPIESHYLWNNRMESSREYLCLIKTTTRQYRKLEPAIIKIHPYEIPEIVAVNINHGFKPYLRWINQSTRT